MENQSPLLKLTTNNSNAKKIGLGCGGCLVILIILGIIGAITGSTTHNPTSNSTNNNSSNTTGATTPTPVSTATPIPKRQVAGSATTLGAGTYQGGKDVQTGLYDVTTVSGQSGNFIVTGTDSVDEILGVSDGQGVSKIRVKISNGDSLEIDGLTKAIFTPVTTAFNTAYQQTSLYAGTWTVGQDIGVGRYVATTTAGNSGNFIVTGPDTVDEILGVSDGQGVPSVTVNLNEGDTIEISSLNQVNFTPTK